MIRAASMCSGIGAPETALPDWDWLWSAEIEPFPSRVLAARSPHSVNLGDLTAPDFCERAQALGPVDVLIAGTPCQDFSIAGLRAGLNGERGNIMLRALQIYEDQCHAARLAGRPEPIFWWENVPGVLSDRTNAFGCLLAGLAGSADPLVPPGRCGWTSAGVVAGPTRNVAWRVLDAQYFGVPQRRERVFVVAGSRTSSFDPAKVFLERKSLCGNPAQGRKARESIAPTLGRGSPGGRSYGLDADTIESLQPVATSLRGQSNCSHRADMETFVPVAFGGGNRSGSIDVASCLTAKGVRQDFEVETFIAQPVPFDTTQITSRANRSVPRPGAPCHPLAAGAHAPAIAFDCKASGQNGFGVGSIASTMRSMGHTGSHQNGGGHLAVAVSHAVRRLMPIECERLQGFPDFHTDIPNGNRPAADGPRYKVLGNSMAVPVIRWIGERIGAQIERSAVALGETP